MSKTLIAILSLIAAAIVCAVIYFRRPLLDAAKTAYTVLKTGYVAKPAAKPTTEA